MNTNTVLNKVRELLGMQIELEQRKLDDGVTVVEADAFEVDAEIFSNRRRTKDSTTCR